MCGIVGMIGTKLDYTDEKVFKTLLQVDTLRGAHSTGMLVADSVDYSILKKAVDGYTFTDLKQYDKTLLNMPNSQFLLGHNRYATTGAVNNRNAHPFECGDTVLVHNGSLNTGWKGYLKDASKTQVDSEAICFNIEHEGMKATVEKLDGAFMLVSYNKSTGEIQMCRNDERPMYYTVGSTDGNIYFASEAPMLDLALQRNNIGYGKVMELATSKIWTLNLNDLDILGESTVEEVKLLEKQVVQYDRYASQWYQSSYGTTVDTVTLADLGLTRNDEVLIDVDSVTEFANTCTLRGVVYCSSTGKRLLEDAVIYSVPLSKKKVTMLMAKPTYYNHTQGELVVDRPEYLTQAEESAYVDLIWSSEATTEESDNSTQLSTDGDYWDNNYDFCKKERFEELTKCGCTVCGNPISATRTESYRIIWLEDDKPVCGDCVDTHGGNAKTDEEVKENILESLTA